MKRRSRCSSVASTRAASSSPLLFTSVRVALQAYDAPVLCLELLQHIQTFIDYPDRWLELHVPTTKALELMQIPRAALTCRLATRDSKALNRAMMLAAARGYHHILAWLDVYFADAAVPVSRHVMDVAAAFGRLDVVQWLHMNRGEGCSQAAMVAACALGRVDILDWLVAHTDVKCPSWTRSWVIGTMRDRDAASCDIVAVLAWLRRHDLGGAFTAGDMDAAALEGRLDIVEFLHAHSSAGCTTDAMDNAAQRGHLAVVEFLHQHRTEGCTTNAMDMAAVHGHLDVVQFLHAHRTEGCTTIAMDFAARANHLTVVKWLHFHRTEGCTVAAMNGAIRANHLDVVQFLHSHRSEGCSPRVLLSAVLAGNLALAEWLYAHERSKFTPATVREAIAKARQFGHGDVARFLSRIQCDVGEV